MDKINKTNNLLSEFKDNNSDSSQQKDKNNQQNNNKENDKISFTELLESLNQQDKKNKEENNANTNTTNSTRNQWIQDKGIGEDGRNDTRFERRTNIQDAKEGLFTQIDTEFKDIKQDEKGTSEEREGTSRAETKESRAEIETSRIGIQRRYAQAYYEDLSNNPQQAISYTKILLENKNKLYEEIIKQEKQREHEKKNKSKNFSRDA